MGRFILAVIGGLIAWTAIATLVNIGLRLGLPGYAVAEPALAFTLAMMIARLAMAVIASLGAGAVIRTIAPSSRWAPWIMGGLTLAMFLPVHVQLWPRFPVWYHLFFLGTLPLFVALGAHLRGAREASGVVSTVQA